MSTTTPLPPLGSPASRGRVERRWSTLAPTLGAAALALALWWGLSWWAGGDVLPGPWATLRFLAQETSKGLLWHHLAVTLRRVLLGFAVAMALGVAWGLLMGMLRWADRAFESWLSVALMLPRIVIIVICYVLIGLNDTAAVAATAASVLPSIAANVREAVRTLDPALAEMAEVFHAPAAHVWRYLRLPQLVPALVGSARGAMSLAWKMVVFVELMGRSDGVGYQIAFYFQMFNMTGIMAYGLAMVVVLGALDVALLALSERLSHPWRNPRRWHGIDDA